MSNEKNAVSIIDRVRRIEELSFRAKIFLDLWVGLQLDTALEPFPTALDEFDDFWRFTRTAHESTFLIRICNLFKRDRQTENFPALIDAAATCRAIDGAVAHSCRQIILDLGDLPARALHIRDNAMAHQSRRFRQNEIFSEAQISLDLMTQLSDAALEMAAILMAGVGLQPNTLETRPHETLRDLLSFVEQQLIGKVNRGGISRPDRSQQD